MSFSVLFLILIPLLGILFATMQTLPGPGKQWREVDHGAISPEVIRLQDTIDELTQRIVDLEEERDFFKELRSPDSPAGLASPDG
ncbi:MAG: hypothetical protein OSA81_06710 [Longimicrobiales bacterium]|nr:hypothetical protein [Longimicrobiales bacterium]